MATASYFALSRGIAASVRAVVPLFAAYEVGLLLLHESERRNAADILLRNLLDLHGPMPVVAMHAAVLIALIIAVARTRATGLPMGRIFPLLVLESVFWAVLLAPAVLFFGEAAHIAIGRGLPREAWEDIVFGIGAGLYEELLFRLILLGGALRLLQLDHPFGVGRMALPRMLLTSLLILATAYLFSAFHHLLGGEPFAARVFLFRWFAGIYLGLLYLFRGFGVVVWTHAIYNVLLAVAVIR